MTDAVRIRSASSRIALGWREYLSLPVLGVDCIRAKIDTGARSSSLHVREHQLFEHDDGRRMVRFEIEHGLRGELCHEVETEVIAQRHVTDSGGHRSLRLFISTRIEFPGGKAWPIEINLTQRRNMLFPMLLGRTALRRRCVVDPSRSFLLGRPGEPGASE
jgi:hypothetical protein